MSTRAETEVENGAVRKHDELTVTHEKDRAARDRYFNDDGNKVTDLPFVGARSPDTDPDDRTSELETTEP